MSRAPFYWPSASPAREISAMTNSAPMRPMESQLQQENSSFSVGMKHQWQPKKAVFSMGCPTHETRGGSVYMEQMSLKLQQKKASFSAGIEPQWQPKKAAFSVDQQHQTWGKELENEASRRDKGTSSGLDEECKEFVRMFREKLQEFAMILSKKYHYNFPVEYFDDYHGSFNKEEFLKKEQPRQELIHLNVPHEGWQERNEGLNQIADFSSSQGKFLANYDLDSSSIPQQQIQSDEEFLKPVAAGEKLKEAVGEVKSFVKGNKIPTAVLVLPLVGKSECLSITLKDEQIAGKLVSQPSVFKTTHNEDDEKGKTYVVAGQLREFRNDRHLKDVGLQISATTCDKERLNSLKAFDVDTLTAEKYPRTKKKRSRKRMIKERTTKL